MAGRRYPRSSNVGTANFLHVSANGTAVQVKSATGPTGGIYLDSVIVNNVGTGVTLTLYHGDPGAGGVAFAVIVPTHANSLDYEIALDNGLWYTMASSAAGDFTITFFDMEPTI